jgi:hypothetical protein
MMVGCNGERREEFLWELNRFDVGCKGIFFLEDVFSQCVKLLEGG